MLCQRRLLLLGTRSLLGASGTRSSSTKEKAKLVEVGKLLDPSNEPYKAGQIFIHKVFSYRGILLYNWEAKVYDKTLSPSTPGYLQPEGQTNTEKETPSLNSTSLNSSQELQGSHQTYYKALIDNQDRPFLKMPRDEGFTVLSADGMHADGGPRKLYTVRGIDVVAHSDILPVQSKIPIQNDLFRQFFVDAVPDVEPAFVANPTLGAWQAKYEKLLDVSTINRETTHGVRVTVIPFYIGCREDRNVTNHYWQYTVRIENLKEETITLRERLWKVFSISGTLENVSGRGVVGYEPTLSPESPSFQYSSHVSLQAQSGHMWGEFLMERKNGENFTVKIPPFTLDSVTEKATVSPT